MGVTRPPMDSKGYKILVAPEDPHLTCYDFVLLVPQDEPDGEKLARLICEQVLDHGDSFSIYTLGPEIDDDIKRGIPILCYNPDYPEVWDWLTCPPHMRN